jgi:hypothetical protein
MDGHEERKDIETELWGCLTLRQEMSSLTELHPSRIRRVEMTEEKVDIRYPETPLPTADTPVMQLAPLLRHRMVVGIRSGENPYDNSFAVWCGAFFRGVRERFKDHMIYPYLEIMRIDGVNAMKENDAQSQSSVKRSIAMITHHEKKIQSLLCKNSIKAGKELRKSIDRAQDTTLHLDDDENIHNLIGDLLYTAPEREMCVLAAALCDAYNASKRKEMMKGIVYDIKKHCDWKLQSMPFLEEITEEDGERLTMFLKWFIQAQY